MERSEELGSLEVSGPWDRVVVVSGNLCGRVLVNRSLDVVFKFLRGPEVADEALVLPFHEIQSQVESLLFGQEHLVEVNGGGWALLPIRGDLVELLELLSQRLLGLVEDVHGIAY